MPTASNATPLQVGANLRAAVERAGLSQGEFARRLGIHPTTASRLVAGSIRMSVDTLIQASELLGVEPCTLLRGDTAPCAGGDR